jgi:hypothetical protein
MVVPLAHGRGEQEEVHRADPQVALKKRPQHRKRHWLWRSLPRGAGLPLLRLERDRRRVKLGLILAILQQRDA